MSHSRLWPKLKIFNWRLLYSWDGIVWWYWPLRPSAKVGDKQYKLDNVSWVGETTTASLKGWMGEIEKPNYVGWKTIKPYADSIAQATHHDYVVMREPVWRFEPVGETAKGYWSSYGEWFVGHG